MSEIQTFPFKRENFDQIKAYKFGKNWPVVYVLENKQEIYIGQTVNAHYRSKQHFENSERRKLNKIHVISDDEFNVSAALDIESWLIQYIAADGQYVLQNGNRGLKNHNYYDRVKYKTKFDSIWDSLREMGIVKNTLDHLKNTDLFKYSPYKTLNEDQLAIARSIVRDLRAGKAKTIIVSGKPGTGKTVLATYIVKYLQEKEETKDLKVGLVVPMASLRGTIAKVFSKIKGLKASMVLGPNDVVKENYDLLIVDEAHRLQRRKGIMGYGSYDKVNQKLGLPVEATQLDWIMKSSKFQIFFYDKNQSIKPADVRPEDFQALESKKYELKAQMRIEAGEDFVQFIEAIFDLTPPPTTSFDGYDFRLFEGIEEMVSEIKKKDRAHKLARVVSGYAWPWHTKPGSKSEQDYDIEIDGLKLIWNSTTRDWVNSKNALNEVGCIHTIQGYDLNYVGVIIGPELSYNPHMHQLEVDKNKYFDTNGRNGITDPRELEQYIKNIYKTLLTRGILGTYVYVADENLRQYIKQQLGNVEKQKVQVAENTLIPSPITVEMVQVPLVGTAPCGNPLLGEENIEEYISVPKAKLRPGATYFIVQAEGDSMNLAGIQEGDLLLCRSAEKGETGDRVVALLGGENVTIKEYGPRENGIRLLLPRSTNDRHKPITPSEGDSIQGIVQEVLNDEE